MLAEEIYTHFQPAFIEADIASVTVEEAVAPFAPDPEADIITQNGTTGCCKDHQPDGEFMCRPRIDCGNQQHRLTWERNPYTLDGNKQEHSPIAIGHQEMLEVRHGDMEHLTCAFSFQNDTVSRTRVLQARLFLDLDLRRPQGTRPFLVAGDHPAEQTGDREPSLDYIRVSSALGSRKHVL